MLNDSISEPKVAAPRRSCDCHVHVFDPMRFPYVPDRTYTPGPATVADLLAFQRRIGFERVVLVQPSGYGTDNRCLVDALSQLGTARARGVAVVDTARIRPAETDAMHAAGVRAIRLNMEVKGGSGVERTQAALTQALEVAAQHDWVVQLYVDIAVVDGIADTLARARTPVVLDHFAGLGAEAGIAQAGFSTLLELLKSAPVHVKLSAAYRASKSGPGDLSPYVRALADAGPTRLVWGSDWPHTGSSSNRTGDLSVVEPFRTIDDGRAVDMLADWIDDPDLRHRILVDNAVRLFRFDE